MRRTNSASLGPLLGPYRTFVRRAATSDFDPDVWSGRASQEVFVELAVGGLASMYPAFAWSSWAPGRHGNQRACDLISGQTSAGHSGHQCSQAPGRPILHLISSSRRPRRVENGLHHCVLPILRWTIKRAGWPPQQTCSPRSCGHGRERSRRCAPACWRARSPAHCGAAASWPLRSRV
jgi:hypothetical protein